MSRRHCAKRTGIAIAAKMRGRISHPQ